VDFLAFTEDGSLCVAKGDTSALWDVFGKWELSKVLGGDEAASPIVNRVTSLDFSPDGKHLASGGGDPSRTGEILVWNLEDGKLIHNLPGVHSDTVHSIEFSRDGKRLASGAADKFARVTEIKTGALVHSFEGHTHHVMGVSLQANGRVLASVGADKEIKVWNVVNGDRAGKGGGYTKEITSIHFVGYGDNALITTADKKAKVIRVPLGNPGNVRDLSGVADVMHAGDVSRNGKVAVAGGEDGVFRVWNIADGKALQTFESPAKEDPDGLTAN
jgi:WD40 repeat protein